MEIITMNENMEKSRLVQRLKKPTGCYNPFSFGSGLKNGGLTQDAFDQLNKIFSFDLMGAAEFEFGAIPKALEKMFDNKSDFVKGFITVNWKTTRWKTGEAIKGKDKVYFLCHKEQRKEVKRRITSWATGNNISGLPKCSVSLDYSFDSNFCQGWLELDNGFFFFIDKEMWKNTNKLFGVK